MAKRTYKILSSIVVLSALHTFCIAEESVAQRSPLTGRQPLLNRRSLVAPAIRDVKFDIDRAARKQAYEEAMEKFDCEICDNITSWTNGNGKQLFLMLDGVMTAKMRRRWMKFGGDGKLLQVGRIGDFPELTWADARSEELFEQIKKTEPYASRYAEAEEKARKEREESEKRNKNTVDDSLVDAKIADIDAKTEAFLKEYVGVKFGDDISLVKDIEGSTSKEWRTIKMLKPYGLFYKAGLRYTKGKLVYVKMKTEVDGRFSKDSVNKQFDAVCDKLSDELGYQAGFKLPGNSRRNNKKPIVNVDKSMCNDVTTGSRDLEISFYNSGLRESLMESGEEMPDSGQYVQQKIEELEKEIEKNKRETAERELRNRNRLLRVNRSSIEKKDVE